MKKSILSILLFLSFFATLAQSRKDVYVRGYTRSNGTYVQGHYRTAPDHTINNNYSTYPNVNPYTGTMGTISPTRTYSYQRYSNLNYSNSSYNIQRLPQYRRSSLYRN